MGQVCLADAGGLRLQVALGTRHGKERVFGPLLAELGWEVVVPPDFPSDDFGTFTSEIPRPGTQLETARLKARAAAQAAGLSRALASEGAYGPDPFCPFVALGRELVLYLDLEQQVEVEGWWYGHQTNFRSDWAHNWEQAQAFAQRVRFPSHALIVRQDPNEPGELYKGVSSTDQLKSLVTPILEKQGKVFLESDMRAMHNPTRMERISEAVVDFNKAFASLCPECETPGFRVRDVVRGLLCSSCERPTERIKEEVLVCQRCRARRQRPRAGRAFADPGECQFCNP